SFSGGNSQYCSPEAAAARQNMIDDDNWTITDGGQDSDCTVDPEDAFITTWETTADNEEITIPVNPTVSGYDYTVDWGDGTVDYNQTGDAPHTYATAGTYTVSITGDFPAIKMGESSSANAHKLMTIEQWGTQEWETMNNAFRSCTTLQGNFTDVPDLSQVT